MWNALPRLGQWLIDDFTVHSAFKLFAFFSGAVYPVLVVTPVNQFVKNCHAHEEYAAGLSIAKSSARLKLFHHIRI